MSVPPDGQAWLQGVPPALQAWASLFYALILAGLGVLAYRKPRAPPETSMEMSGAAIIDSKYVRENTAALGRVASLLERDIALREGQIQAAKDKEQIEEVAEAAAEAALEAVRREMQTGHVAPMPPIRKRT